MSLIQQISHLIFSDELDRANKMLADLEDTNLRKIFESMIASSNADYIKQYSLCQEVLDDKSISPLMELMAYEGIAWSYIRRGDYNAALTSALKGEKLIINLGDTIRDEYPELIPSVFNTLGSISLETGDLGNAERYYVNALHLYDELGYDKGIASINNNLAFVYQKNGELIKALNMYEHSLKIQTRIKSPRGIGRVKSNIAEIYRFLTNYEKALQYHIDVLELRKQYDNKYDLALSNYYVGLTNYELNHFRLSIKYLMKSRKLWKNVGNDQWLSATLLTLGKANEGLGREYNEVYEELSELAERNENDIIYQRYLLLSSIKKRSSRRIIEAAEAQSNLKTILSMDVLDFELTYEASLLYCELLFVELRFTNDEKIFQEIKKQIESLESISKDNSAYGRLIEIYFLKAKLAIIENKYSEADKLIHQSQIMAKEHGLDHFQDIITNVMEELKQDIMKIQNIIDLNKTIFDRLEIIELKDYLTKAFDVRKELDNES